MHSDLLNQIRTRNSNTRMTGTFLHFSSSHQCITTVIDQSAAAIIFNKDLVASSNFWFQIMQLRKNMGSTTSDNTK